MYLTHFGLKEPPFGMTPNPSFFFAGNNRGEILEALTYAVMHGEGIIKVTGEVGSGKTMLCRMLENQLPAHVEVIYLVNPTLTREQVIYAIAGELELATSGKRVDEVIRMLHSDLIAKHISGKQVVLLIEEAQAMPLDTLEEIRLFSNLETAHHKLLQIVMFGQPELNDHLSLPRMRQLKERITHSFTVPPMPPTVIPEYLMFRLRIAGYRGPDIFSRGAIRLISRVSTGIVRRISILADKSMLAAFAGNAYSIKPKHVRAAIEDSEFPQTALRMMDRRTTIAVSTLGLLVAASVGWYFFWIKPSAAAVEQSRLPQALVSLPPTPKSGTAEALPSDPKPPPASSDSGPVTSLASSAQGSQPLANPNAATPESAITFNHSSAPRASDRTVGMESTPTDAPANSEAGLTLQQRLELTNSWLKEQPAERYSIQIILISSDDTTQIQRELQKITSETEFHNAHVYSSHKASGSRYGIVYGSFATRAEAMAKLVQLSGQWGNHLQLRTIGGIKREIGSSLD